MPESSVLTKIIYIQLPKTKKQVRSLLVRTKFYSPFMPTYAEIVACLTELTVGPATRGNIKWLPRHDEALHKYKKALTCVPFLQIPNLSSEFYVFTDCSTIALARCLCQMHDNHYLPCRFIRRKLSNSESRRAVTDLEVLAVVFSINKWSRYLLGRLLCIFLPQGSKYIAIRQET